MPQPVPQVPARSTESPRTRPASGALPSPTEPEGSTAPLMMRARMTSSLPTMTIVVPTFRRREAVVRLLRAFAAELERDGAGVDVLVAVDGSEDGTVEAVEALSYPV